MSGGGKIIIRKAAEMAHGGKGKGKVVIQKAEEFTGVKAEVVAMSGGTPLRPGEQMPLDRVRAVTAEEAPYVLPARESTKVTMMPWRGRVKRFVKDTFGEEKFNKWHDKLYFAPDDIYDSNQVAFPAGKKVPIDKMDPSVTHQYRYPSPGSTPAVNVPRLDIDDPDAPEDPYDSGHFKRDTRRRYAFSELDYIDPEIKKAQLELMDPNGTDEEVQEELKKLQAGPESSPGNKGRFATGPTKFDPSGLRATMSVSWAATNAELDKHMPDHLPTPTWVGQEEELQKWYDERDLPAPIGGYYDALKVPTHLRVARW